MAEDDRLAVWGRPLFADGLLAERLEAQLLARVRRERDALLVTRRRVSRLQLRRRLAAVAFPGAVTLVPAPAMTVVAGGMGGRPAVRHVSRITGDPALLEVAPGRGLSGRHPVAVVDEDRLIVTVRFAAADRPYESRFRNKR